MSSNPPGEPWESVAFISPSRMTRKTFSDITGAQIAGLTVTYSNMPVVCTADGSGFTKDTAYLRNTDNTAWIGLGGGQHLHDLATEGSGGLFSNIKVANQAKAFVIDRASAISEFQFMQEGSAAITDEPANSTGNRIKIDTGTASGTYGHLSLGGAKLSFAQQSQFMWKGNIDYSGNGNVTAYIGVGVASVNETHNNPQYGIQVCDSSSTERAWELVNGNGTTKAVTTSTENVKQAGIRGYRILYTPGLNSRFYVNGSQQALNSSAILASGSTTGSRNVSMGIKTNTGTTRTMYIHGVSLMGTIADAQWV